MALTQKYKQQRQQVRVITNSNNYLKGMYFTDSPLVEGYSRTLLNFDIDSVSGKLTPRRGLKTIGLIPPTVDSRTFLDNTQGFSTVYASKICAASDSTDPRKINKALQGVMYNTATQSLSILTCDAEINSNSKFKVIPFTLNSSAEYVTPEPFVIDNPGIHDKTCVHNNFFKRPVGTFAFGNSYYTFLKRRFIIKKIADLPNEAYPGIADYADLIESTAYNTGTPGEYFKFTSGVSDGVLAYYDAYGNITRWYGTEENLKKLEIVPPTNEYILCYTKLGKEIQDDEILLDTTINHESLNPDTYYTCIIVPQKLNPTEAASWGYNMLLQNPYTFVGESTAVNNITILGIIPYAKDSNVPVLTPRKNQEITLKAYYRAPTAFYSDANKPKFYSTTKIKDITAAERDELLDVNTVLTDYNFGDWWYCTDDSKYYMCMPGATLQDKRVALFGETKPAASEKLCVTVTGNETEVRVRWQMRSAGSADWIDLYNEKTTLSAYYTAHGALAPFTLTTTMPEEEVLIKLTISDTADVTTDPNGEEYVLTTNTISLSLVSDELVNTLNLTAQNFELGRCTGMCEWEQRIAIWGVPGALNTLFISDVNNPTFFPYPNNVDIFTDPIIAVHNYGQELLVLTTTALYRLTWESDGLGWTHTLVQQNLHVTEADTYMSCVIKNMFFFKSGDYYYMMVPKASSSSIKGEVAIAPIYKSISGLLDNFHKEVYNLIKVIVDTPTLPDFTDKLVNYYSYVDGNKIVVNYIYALDDTTSETTVQSITDSKYLYIQLIYDTDTRAWSMRAFEAAHMLYASHADTLQQDRFIDLTPTQDSDKYVLQYYKFEELSDNTVQYLNNSSIAQAVTRIIKNYQYLDTGNCEINTELKKRFREFQFKIKNTTATNLGFYTSFLIDGSLRKDLQHYNPRLISDGQSNEGIIVIERTLDPGSMTYNTTRIERILVPERMLQDNGELTPTTLANENDPDRWVLNQSAFPGRTFWKIRMPISGKGYTPRAILLSTNEAEYDILGHDWVYRTMNGR